MKKAAFQTLVILIFLLVMLDVISYVTLDQRVKTGYWHNNFFGFFRHEFMNVEIFKLCLVIFPIIFGVLYIVKRISEKNSSNKSGK